MKSYTFNDILSSVIWSIVITFLLTFMIGSTFGDCNGRQTAAPRHAYIEDVNHDGIQDVRVVSKYKATILYGTKGSNKLRRKADILKEVKEREGKKYK